MWSGLSTTGFKTTPRIVFPLSLPPQMMRHISWSLLMIFMSISKNVQIPHVDSNHTTWQYYKIAVSKEKKEIGPSLWFYFYQIVNVTCLWHVIPLTCLPTNSRAFGRCSFKMPSLMKIEDEAENSSSPINSFVWKVERANLYITLCILKNSSNFGFYAYFLAMNKYYLP